MSVTFTANVNSDGPHPVNARLYQANPDKGHGEFVVLTISGVTFYLDDLAEASDLVRRLDDAITEQMHAALVAS